MQLLIPAQWTLGNFLDNSTSSVNAWMGLVCVVLGVIFMLGGAITTFKNLTDPLHAGSWTARALVGCAVVLTLVALALLVHRSVSSQRAKRAAARAARGRIEREWTKARAVHKKMTDNLMRAETDWDWLFSMPLLTDPSVRQTADFYRAMGDLNRTDDAVPVWLDAGADVRAQPYPKACAKAQRCWDDAFAHAKKIGLKTIPLAERRLVEKAKRLLSLAEDSSASENERALAYSQAMAVLEKLTSFHIPEKALAGLEASHRKLLTAQ